MPAMRPSWRARACGNGPSLSCFMSPVPSKWRVTPCTLPWSDGALASLHSRRFSNDRLFPRARAERGLWVGGHHCLRRKMFKTDPTKEGHHEMGLQIDVITLRQKLRFHDWATLSKSGQPDMVSCNVSIRMMVAPFCSWAGKGLRLEMSRTYPKGRLRDWPLLSSETSSSWLAAVFEGLFSSPACMDTS